MRFCVLGMGIAVVGAAAMAGCIQAQGTQVEGYSRKNTWTVFTEYSNTSSHILMGASRQRKLVTLGGAYTRRLLHSRVGDLGYVIEVRPLVFESDPVATETSTGTIEYPPPIGTVTSTSIIVGPTVGICQSSSGTFSFPASGDVPPITDSYSVQCGRRWTFAQQLEPIGWRYAFRPQRRVQPFVVGTLGYMYSNRPIPTADAGSFNFVFTFGAGVEVFRWKRGRSVAAEARFSHFSNKDSAAENPGTDNVLYRVSYSFGR